MSMSSGMISKSFQIRMSISRASPTCLYTSHSASLRRSASPMSIAIKNKSSIKRNGLLVGGGHQSSRWSVGLGQVSRRHLLLQRQNSELWRKSPAGTAAFPHGSCRMRRNEQVASEIDEGAKDPSRPLGHSRESRWIHRKLETVCSLCTSSPGPSSTRLCS